MKYKAGIFLFLFTGLQALAQQPSRTFESPYLRFQLNTKGAQFQNNGSPAFEVPKDSGIHALIASALWIGAKDSSGNVRLAIATYDTAASDFQAGPLDRSTVLPDDPSYWNNVWMVDSAMVAEHRTLYNNQGYQAPADISNWPGNNKRPGNYNPVLAPFVDFNGNAQYEPGMGEIPYINKAWRAAYVIMNDAPGTRRSATPALGLEVHATFYTVSALPNTVFVKYNIVNRAYRQYDSLFVGVFTDFGLGNPNDNYVSTDSARNSYFAYNGLPYDTNGYLDRPAILGVTLLNQTLKKSISFDWGSSVTGWPQTPREHFQYLAGRWRDDSPLVDPTSSQSSFHFLGDPCNGSGWTEFGSSGIEGRRSMLGSMGPQTLGHGEVITLHLAYVFTREQSNVLDNVCDYYDDVDAARDYWHSNLSNTNPVPEPRDAKVYPNPASHTLHWDIGEETAARAVLVNSLGQEFQIEPTGNTLSVAGLPAGMYVLKLQTESGRYFTARVILTL